MKYIRCDEKNRCWIEYENEEEMKRDYMRRLSETKQGEKPRLTIYEEQDLEFEKAQETGRFLKYMFDKESESESEPRSGRERELAKIEWYRQHDKELFSNEPREPYDNLREESKEKLKRKDGK